MTLLEKRISKLERPNVDKFDARLPTSWGDFYSRIKDESVRQSASALTAAEAWAVCSRALAEPVEESLEGEWQNYLLCRKNWANGG
jgi:hypothetical protein